MVPQPSSRPTENLPHGDGMTAAVGVPVRRSSNTKENLVNLQPIGSAPLTTVGSNSGKVSNTSGKGVGKGSSGKGSVGKGIPVGASSWGKGTSKGAWGKGATSPVQHAGCIEQLTGMGFTEEAAKSALTSCVWDVNKALDALLSGTVMCTEKGVDHPEKVMDHMDAEAREGVASSEAAKKVEPGNDLAENSTTASDVSTPRSTQADVCRAPSPPSSVVDTSENVMPQQVEQPLCPLVENNSCLPNADGKNTYKDGEHAVYPFHAKLADKDGSSLMSTEVNNAEKKIEIAKEKDEENDADKIKLAVSDGEVAEELGKTLPMNCPAPAPTRQLARVIQAWQGGDNNEGLVMLSVNERQILYLWSGSETENGWVYAERPGEVNQAGWVPLCVLIKLGHDYQIMHVEKAYDAQHQTQLCIQQGMILLTNIASRTDLGWVYAEHVKVGVHSDTETPEKEGEGWVPILCLK